MRGSVSTLIVLLVCLVAVLLYWFAGRPQLVNQISQVKSENQELTTRLAEINEMERNIPKLMGRLPEWRSKLELYQAAIPTDINDERFLDTINQQLKAQNVELLTIELAKGGAWLGQLGESQIEELKQKGIDPDVARKIQVAFYSVSLIGDFGNVISAFENLKTHNRLFSIDQVEGPVGGGGGMINLVENPNNVPIQLTGRIYYGVPGDYLTVEQLVDVFNTAVIIPQARSIQSKVAIRGRQLVSGTEPRDGAPAADPAATQVEPPADEPIGEPESIEGPGAGEDTGSAEDVPVEGVTT